MVDRATLSLSIDASGAKNGAAEFSRAVGDIKKKAAEMGRAVEHGSKAFGNVRTASNRSQSSISPGVLSGTIQGSSTISSNNFIVLDILDAIETSVEKKREEKRRKEERERKIKEDDAFAIERKLIANEFSNGTRELARLLAIERLENAQRLEKINMLPELEREQRQLDIIKGFEDDTGINPLTTASNRLPPGVRAFKEGLSVTEEELQEPRARNAARGEEAAYLTRFPTRELNRKPELIPDPNALPGGGSSQGDGDDGRANRLIEGTIRGNELLIQQNNLINAVTTALAEQKKAQDQVNQSLNDNATLRQQTEDQTSHTVESEAANENLANALESSGRAAQQLRTDVDGLNTALAANAGINTEVVRGLEKERDVRGQVNDAIVERRQLEEDQKQRLIREQDETERRGKAVEASIEQIKDAAKDSFKDVIKGTESIGDAFQKLADRITDILLDLALDELLKGGTGFSDLFGAVFGGIGSIFGGGAPANLAGPAGVGILPIGHQGGVIGQDRFPLRRFHQGGFPGLRPDEIPIVAQRGEEILARGDPRNAANNNGAGGGNVVVNVSFPNARNTGEARQAGSEIAAKAAAAAQRGMTRKGIG